MFSPRTIVLSLLSLQAIGHVAAHSDLHQRAAVELHRPTWEPKYSNFAEVKKQGHDANLVAKNPVDRALEFASKVAPDATFRLSDDHYTGKNGVTHVYLKQTHHGIDIINADMNINIAKDGSVLSYGDSFVSDKVTSDAPSMGKYASPKQAIDSVTQRLNLPITGSKAEKETDTKFHLKGSKGANQDPSAELFYYKTKDGSVKPVWSVHTDMKTDWFHSLIDAEDTDVVESIINYTKDDAAPEAQYKVFPWGCSDPDHCKRELVNMPAKSKSSPFGWQSKKNKLQGNNALSETISKGQTKKNGYRPTGKNGIFDFPLDLTPGDDYTKYRDASLTQVYYMANMYHDVLYDFGFDEKSGNYALNNDNRGGKGHDIVYTVSQNTASRNNAQFHTTPDGKPGVMTIFMYKNKGEWRDGAFDSTVVVHELTHGLSTRLVGGPNNANCLETRQAGGMGEGWGDAMSNAVHAKPSDDRNTTMAHAAWAEDQPKGVRGYPYSTDMKVNPETFGLMNQYFEVHVGGEVWATMMYEILWDLIDKYGIDDCAHPKFDKNGVATTGRFMWIQLATDSMKLSPCNPTFVNARDSLLDADQALTGGENQCLIWKAMAKRGLGEGATTKPSDSGLHLNVVESFKMPKGVC